MPLPFTIAETIGISLLNQGPGPMVEILGVLSFKAIVAAIRLNIFEIIGSGRLTLDQLSAAADTDPVGLSYLVGALKDLGYLKEKRGFVSNSSMVKKWILSNSPSAITDLFESINDASMRWEYLPDSIHEGRPPLLGYQWLDGDEPRWGHYHRGLKCTAALLGPSVLNTVRVPRRYRTLLDLGGGHGHYCIEFCRRHQGLSGVILDWEPAAPVARQNIEDAGMSGRVTFVSGDFVSGDIGGGYDLVLMFNVIRIFDAEALRSLFAKVHHALAPGGTAVILDHMGYAPRSRFIGANAFLVLLEIFNSTIGQIHRSPEVIGMLGEAGFSRIRKKNLPRSPGLTIVQARKR